MNLKSTLLLLTLAGTISAQAQPTMLDPDNEWYYNVYCLFSPQCGYKHYHISGETTVGGYTGQIVDSFTLQELGAEETHTDILRQSGDTVYRYSEEGEIWHILYDFGAQPGDIWEIQTDTYVGYGEPAELELFKVLVDSTDAIAIGPNTHRVVYTSAWYDNSVFSSYHFGHHSGGIIEGIGPVGQAHGLTGQSIYVLLPLQSPSFACFIQGGVFVWGNSGSPCNALSTDQTHGFNAGLNIYPNPVRTSEVVNLDLSATHAQIQRVELCDLQGRIVQAYQLNQAKPLINIQDIMTPGMYLIRAWSEHGVFTQKIIIEP